ncbi:MAG: hypothetical protein ACTHMS_05515 [Jatrophihabitans sp.]|uniref:hypothetical protein n=1 Tax=Jatrophihabitans sp. TaxID=1932789 RepID=UPI003F80F5D3
MVFLAVLVAPLLMLLATVAEQRRGGAAAGWVAALPVSLAVAAAAITLDAGAHPAAAVVLAAAQHVPAQVVFAVVAGRRLLAGRPIADSLVVGLLGYVVASVLLVDLDRAVAPAVAVAALVVAPRLLGTGEVRATAPTSRRWTAVGCATCATVVLAAVGLSRLAGPAIAGAAAAFPTMTSALVLSVAVRAGGDAGRRCSSVSCAACPATSRSASSSARCC